MPRTLVLLWSLVVCQEPVVHDELSRQIAKLRAEGVDGREAAEQSLKALPTSCVKQIQGFLAKEVEPEPSLRLKRVLKHLRLKESDELYQAEKLTESLKKSLEADGVQDIDAAFERRLREVAVDVKAVLLPPEPVGPSLIPSGEDVAKLLKKHGRWAFPALIDALRDSANELAKARSVFVLKSTFHIAPALREALRGSKNDASLDDACCLIFHEKGDTEELRRISKDERVTPRARETATQFLRQRGQD